MKDKLPSNENVRTHRGYVPQGNYLVGMMLTIAVWTCVDRRGYNTDRCDVGRKCLRRCLLSSR